MSAPEPPWSSRERSPDEPPAPAEPLTARPAIKGSAPNRSLPARPAVEREDLRALVDRLFKGRWRTDEQFEGLCPLPAHEDSQPSFGIRLRPNRDRNGVDGWTLDMKCQKCTDATRREFCAAAGIEERDCYTFDPRTQGKGRSRPAALPPASAQKAPAPTPAAPEIGRPARTSSEKLGKLDAVYPYTDENGVLLFEVERWSGVAPDFRKTFRRRRPAPGGYIWDTHGVRSVVMRLPAVRELAGVEGKRLFYVEGEKDVLSLERMQLTATTNPGGAGKWLDEWGEQLRGVAEVAILPDNDDAGAAHAELVRSKLEGIVGRVEIVDLAAIWPEIPVKGDVSDFLEAKGWTVEAAEMLAGAVRAAFEKPPAPAERTAIVLARPGAASRHAVQPGDFRNRAIPWEDFLERVYGKGGLYAYKPNVYNAGVVLERHPAFEGRLRFDTFARRKRFNCPPWWVAPIEDRLWEDKDAIRFMQWANKELRQNEPGEGPNDPPIVGPGTEFKKQTVHDAADVAAWDHPVHPLRDWLNGLKWDGKRRLLAWLVKHCNAELGRYSEVVGTAWMVSAVARVMEPGCKVDHMLVLRGGQGVKKTSIFNILGGEYYDSMQGTKLDVKEGKHHLIGKWILEFAELEHMDRHAVSVVKAFLTERVDRFRKVYQLEEGEFPRQCVFCGSINEQEFLRDETGNRRFWVVECGNAPIDYKRLEAEREQLWAEAVDRYRQYVAAREAGDEARMAEFQWWLTPEDEALAREVQAGFVVTGPQDEIVREWLVSSSRAPGSYLGEAQTGLGDAACSRLRHITTEEVARFCLKRDTAGPLYKRADQMAVAGAISRAGMAKCRHEVLAAGGVRKKTWFWHEPEAQQVLVPAPDPSAGGGD